MICFLYEKKFMYLSIICTISNKLAFFKCKIVRNRTIKKGVGISIAVNIPFFIPNLKKKTYSYLKIYLQKLFNCMSCFYAVIFSFRLLIKIFHFKYVGPKLY